MDNRTSVVNVEFNELAAASKELSAISSEMKSITENMSKLIQEIRENWQDRNGAEFAKRFETEVQSQFNKYYGTVQEYSDYIKGAHDAYVSHSDLTATTIKG